MKKLGQLIDARPAEEFSCPCRAKIAAARLSYGRPVLENRHRPELEDDKLLRVESGSALLEYDRTAAIELDGDRGNQKKWRQKQYCRHGTNDVQSPLDRSLESGQRRLLDSHRERQPVRGQTTLPQQGADWPGPRPSGGRDKKQINNPSQDFDFLAGDFELAE